MKRYVLLLIVLLAAATSALAQEKKPVRLFAEAEDFKVTSPGWKVIPYRDNYFAGTFAITFLSRMGCLSAPDEMNEGKKAIAEMDIFIPDDDTYELLVRYEQPLDLPASSPSKCISLRSRSRASSAAA